MLGDLEVIGRIATASNATLLVRAGSGPDAELAVYKPVLGEQPLWDFPDGTLAAREVAAYEVSDVSGWDVVPRTVLREGPYGIGSVQRWVGPAPDAAGVLLGHEPAAGLVQVCAPADAPDGWLVAFEGYDPDDDPVVLVHADDVRLARAAVFDAVVNNADRKAGHLLPDGEGAVLGVDHGLTFHADPSCAPCCGAGPATRCPRRSSRGSSALPTPPAVSSRSGCTACSPRRSSRHWPVGCAGCWPGAASRRRGAGAPPSPGRCSDLAAVRGPRRRR